MLGGNVMRAFRVVLRPDMNVGFSNGKAATARSEEVHDSQDEFQGVVHCLGHAVQKRLA
jgi:hypothetical protein